MQRKGNSENKAVPNIRQFCPKCGGYVDNYIKHLSEFHGASKGNAALILDGVLNIDGK